jgi:transcriptional regulator with XRE-family HTH domain
MFDNAKLTSDSVERQLGRNIRLFRQALGLTLTAVARASGMSKGYLSALETGRSAPSVASLVRIAKALDVDVGKLFDGSPADDSLVIVRESARQIARRAGALEGLTYELLAHLKANKLMEPFMIDVAPTRHEYALFDHLGQEFLFVISGTVDFQYKGEGQLLRRGDAAYFDASIPHGVRAYRRRPARLLSVICSARR